MHIDKPTRETLSKAYILQETLILIDQEGVNKFSMRKLGKKMNVSPTAVYRYFPNQGALFDGIVELVWQKVADIAVKDSGNWQKQLFQIMAQLRSILLEHPHVLPLISTHPMVTESEFTLVEKILAILKKNDFPMEATTVFLINTLTVYTIGFVWAEAVDPDDGGIPDPDLMQKLTSKSPLLSDFLKAIQNEEYTKKQQFKMGLNAILKGWDFTANAGPKS